MKLPFLTPYINSDRFFELVIIGDGTSLRGGADGFALNY